ncbi:unnamed protein product [Caenorhabditis angaria]|uniref:Uncharacterized protein n=1 Tax=Caenorhabditis angaria TaxID=860376 RepID=A0A9P1IM11_9PELO|nr:unnamed protein product [Caenorhabditis angaria]
MVRLAKARIELNKILKFGMIGLGVLHFVVWILAVVQCVRQGILIEKHTNIKDGPVLSNVMFPTPFAPFFVAAACIAFAFLPMYFMIYVLTLLTTIEIGLFIWPLVVTVANMKLLSEIVEFWKTNMDRTSQQQKKDIFKKAIDFLNNELEPLYIMDYVVLGIGLFVGVFTILLIGFLAFTSTPSAGGGGFFGSKPRAAKSPGTPSGTATDSAAV